MVADNSDKIEINIWTGVRNWLCTQESAISVFINLYNNPVGGSIIWYPYTNHQIAVPYEHI